MTTGKLTKLIDNLKYEDDKPRDYIGASSIGSECLRQIWYELNCKESFPVSNRIRRIWQTGKILESFILDLIANCGITLTRDVEFVDQELSFFKGHADAIWLAGKDHFYIVEIKTAKDSEFQKVKNHGLKKWNPKYYAQIQSYMGMSGINSAYIVVLNKDNSEVYDEYVEFCEEFYKELRQKAKMIYEAKMPPPKINGSPLFYMCKMCKFKEICHA
jgi:CRISPR/Cas system-associated exonuclease Cas4 (RecB family)